MYNIIPVILSGGSGTRLWPLSRKQYPKQYLPLVGDNAMARIAKNEFNIELKSTFKFVGVFEYFYEVESEEVSDLPIEQHNEYQWFSIDELLKSKQAHKYVKDYFRN